MNLIQLTGRLTKSPETISLNNGDTATALRLAVDGLGHGGVDSTGYIDVLSFGRGGQAAAQWLNTGSLVDVEGRLEYREWQTPEGARRHDYQVVGRVHFLSTRRPTTPASDDDPPTNNPADPDPVDEILADQQPTGIAPADN